MTDNTEKTIEHIQSVGDKMTAVRRQIRYREVGHDGSKLREPELSVFEEFTAKLKNSTYGSEEYNQFLKDMKPALDHHYQNNRHHPEHFKNYNCNGCHTDYKKEHPDRCPVCGFSQFQEESDISQMNLIDVLEMFCDWLAATERHADGDIFRSIELNTERFGMSEQLADIFRNTAIDIFWKEMKDE